MISLPRGWHHDRLKDVAAINASALPANTDPGYEFDYLEISNVDYHGVVDLKAIERLRYEDAPSRARRRVAKNSTLISSVRPNLQSVAFMFNGREDLICSTGFNVAEPNEARLWPMFAYYAIVSENARQYFEAAATGVGYPAVADKDFRAFPVPIPPLAEQRRIAAYLDASCAVIDAAVAAKRRQLEILDALCASILVQAVTKGLDETVKIQTTGWMVLPEIPTDWRLRRLKSIACIRYGLGQPPATLASGVPMIRATDVDGGMIRTENLLRIDPQELPPEKKPYLKAGEIIVVRSGAYTGDSAIVPRELEGSVAGYDMVATVTAASPRFVAYCLLSRYVLEGQILLLTLRAAQPHLNAEELGGVVLALPPCRSEQEAIADFVAGRLAEVSRIVNSIETQIATLTSYRKSLIHECVTGRRRITEADARAIGHRPAIVGKVDSTREPSHA
ncbi:MAG TPA: restriction endonuclease subunit S [Pirellulales bacterium]|nr:restriction endonuclease subunit S [Pirellulales bacterium]